RLREEIDSRSVYDETVELLMNSLGSGSEERVYLEGALNLFEQPEFRDVERAKPVLGFLEQEEAVASMLSELCSRAGTRVVIGQEHSRAEMKECSMVTAAYRPGRSEEHTSELQSRENLVCRLLLEKKKRKSTN